ncbi:MAG: 1-deoxy-D-xylulose-5-phosphate synthase [Clostridia bacterium]|nr:1-deoxy-D-xylulose-5-phosphate synthase [Clostridia bacterium]
MLNRPNLIAELKSMSEAEKEQLANEIRTRLIEVVPQNGGHLATNLGVVELTLALYSVLDPFVDRIVWDVGHQSYVHKLLTGRNAQFDTLRMENGLSGFPKREESTADSFDTGHSSTSISAAIGFARARDLQGEKHRVVAIIGDGAFGNGMTFEALNDAGQITNDMIIILNDNGMSIASNVGGMSRYLGKIRTIKSYVRMKKGVKRTLLRIPKIGGKIVHRIQKFKASLRVLLIPGELFEELGCKYIGPVDGHNIENMMKAIEKAIFLGGPVILHAITKKGKGYQPAEENPSFYHGVSPSGNGVKVPSYSANTGSVLTELAGNDTRITAISAAMGDGTGLNVFKDAYPTRFFDVGIAESHAVTMAAGMAAGGLKPFVCVYSTFMQRAYDQFLHDCALQNLPVTVLLDRAGVSGLDGKTHQGVYDLAFLQSMPNVTIAAPCCVSEQTALIRLALESNSPFVIRYPAKDDSGLTEAFIAQYPVSYGKGVSLLENVNAEVLFVSLGQITSNVMQAARQLEDQGISCAVFHARFMRPFDQEGLLELLLHQNKLKLIVTVEDGVVSGGFGSVVSAAMFTPVKHTSLPILCLGYPNEPIVHGTIEQIHKRYKLDASGIAQQVCCRLKEANLCD